MYSPACHSTDCSLMFLKMKSYCTVLLPSLNPACSFLSSLSTPSLIRFISTFPKILPGTDSKVTPLELSQTVKPPFFGILLIIPFVQPLGISSVSHITLNSSSSIDSVIMLSAFSHSTVIPSLPGAFLFFISLIALLISPALM